MKNAIQTYQDNMRLALESVMWRLRDEVEEEKKKLICDILNDEIDEETDAESEANEQLKNEAYERLTKKFTKTEDLLNIIRDVLTLYCY